MDEVLPKPTNVIVMKSIINDIIDLNIYWKFRTNKLL